MKILTQVFFILLILTLTCDGNTRQKRTLNTFLRYFGFRIVPIDDVEFVTQQNIVESTRNPKAMRIKTQRPSIKVDVEETTTTMRTPASTMTTPRVSSTTQSIPKFNPISPDIINSMFVENNSPPMRPLIDVRNTMKKSTLKPKQVKGTEFLISLPMDMPPAKSQKLVDSIASLMQPQTNMPQIPDFMRPPAMSMNMEQIMQPPAISEMQMNLMESTTVAVPVDINTATESTIEPSTEAMMMASTEAPSISNTDFQDFVTNVNFQSQQQNPNFQSQNFGHNSNYQQFSYTNIPQFQNIGNFEVVKSVEIPQGSFPSQFIIGNSIAVSDHHFPLQTQFSTPVKSTFGISRSGKDFQYKFSNTHFY